MTKLCIFDLDGTLVNSLYDLADAMNYALKKNGFQPHEREKYLLFIGNGISVLADKAMIIPKGMATPEQKKQVLADFQKYYDMHCMDETRPYPGIVELLNELDKRNIKYAVMSNKPDNFAKIIVNTLFPNNQFVTVWGKRDNFERKPSPQAVNALIQEVGVSKDKCLYIGDSNVDIFTAQNAELRCCGVSWGFRQVEELIDAGAEFIANSPEEILTQL